MKIFVLLSRVPYPLDKGDKLRAFNQIKELSKKHTIILCALSDKPVDAKAKEILSHYCAHVEIIHLSPSGIAFNLAKTIISQKPLQVGYFYQKHVKEKIEELIGFHKPDHIYCQLLRVAQYVREFNIPKTIDYMDALSIGMERRINKAPFLLKPVFKIESMRLKKYENEIFSCFDNKTIISEQDRSFISHTSNNQITVIPNGVDSDFFAPILNKEKDYDLLFTGNMNYPPNIECAEYIAREILPEVQKAIPGVRLLISGVNPSSKVLGLKSEFITVTGWVKDIRESYSRSKVFIAPMRIGTGLQNKLLEAMAMNLPCITSELANNALKAIHNTNILIGKNTASYVEHIITLLENEDLRTEFGQSGCTFVNEKYNWEASTELLDRLIQG
ncbi:MAG: glycosyltransferase [Bacteroidetes bacterium]|nr:glycosyltransferase [Bacteroidota bacterium]HET6243637.1 glycosyltransferase [Bacteroidia bacterium]